MKYYVVRAGKKTGIFTSRDECKELVQGFSDAKYKSFKTKEEAENAFKEDYKKFYYTKTKERWKVENLPYEKNSIAVDAACSGNPGQMEYQGVDLPSGKMIFHQKFPLGTNNIGEFLALVHGLQYLKDKKSNKAIYTDSRHAMKRVSEKKCKTKLEKNNESKKIFEVIEKAEKWLQNNEVKTKILKWPTSERGEIPADFGRK